MKYYLVGIKGTGMSALALCLKDMGEMVIGSDKDETYFTENKLNNNKIPIFKFNVNNINKYKNYIFIISYAYNENNNEEVNEIIKKGYEYYYYSDFINMYFKNIKIGISGTHGKTTTATLTSNLLHNDDISSIIGDGSGKGSKNSKYLIFEACEYKYHFINYDYDYLLINNIDYDHPDFYNNISEVIVAFKNASKKTKCLIVNNDDLNARKIKHSCRYTFGIKNKSYVTGTILKQDENGYRIKVNVKDKEFIFDLSFYGKHMIYNFLAAFTIYYLLHNKDKNIEKDVSNNIKKFVNAKRRMEEIILENNNIIIDDYAHHPSEIQSTYDAVKQKYSNHDITIVFQPHTYTRTIYLNNEFKDVFNDKKTYIMNTFTSREEYNNITESIVKEVFKEQEKYDIEKIKSILEKNNQVIIFMGAGNINQEIRKIVSCNL